MMKSSFFTANRKRLRNKLGDGAPIVLVANGPMQMSRDTEYPFEQDRNFFYLTGLELADWVLVIDGDEEYLIAPKLSEVEKIFNGAADEEEAAKVSGVETVLEHKEGRARLKKFNKIRTPKSSEIREWGVFTNPAARVFIDDCGVEVEDITPVLLHLRTIKQPEELHEIRGAVQTTAEAFKSAKKLLDTFKDEAQLEAVFTGHFASEKSRHGYSPIVASGANACTLHYIANTDNLPGKGLVLIDIGARANNYSADVTRTWELLGASKRQIEVVEATKEAFDEILKVIKPGLAFDEYQKHVDEVISTTLGHLKLQNDEEGLRKYLPHAPTHGLGLDVHDPIVGYEKFESGMVITLEPGIYIPDEGIGVRHEDDLLVVSDGVENLSKEIK